MTLGMWVAGAGLLVRVRHDWGPAALTGLPRTLVLALLALALGLAVHRLADGHWPDGALAATLVGALAAAVVAGVVLLVGLWIDPTARARVPGLRGWAVAR